MTDPPSIEAVDLDRLEGTGPLWGIASEDLNATLLSWPAGDGVTEHRNTERDVLIVATAGSGILTLDGHRHELTRHQAILIPKGASHAIHAGPHGIRYLSVHLRRAGLQIDAAAG
jgi:quercetin dioxygenase-like cupin family protein